MNHLIVPLSLLCGKRTIFYLILERTAGWDRDEDDAFVVLEDTRYLLDYYICKAVTVQ